MLNLICPDCRGELKGLICQKCKRKYKSIEGIPNLLPKRLSYFKDSEKEFYSKEFKKENNLLFDYVKEEYLKDSWNLLKHFDILQNMSKDIKILELGAGNGQYGLILKKRGFGNVVITDISLTGLIAAKEYAKKNHLSYKDMFYATDAESLPFENDSFDIIFIVAALHHMETVLKTVNEIKRCLKPGGLAIIAVEPNRWYLKILRPITKFLKIRRVQKEESSLADEKTEGFTMKELQRYLSDFRIIKKQNVWYLTGIMYYLPDMIKRVWDISMNVPIKLREVSLKIDELIERIPVLKRFSFHITITAQK